MNNRIDFEDWFELAKQIGKEKGVPVADRDAWRESYDMGLTAEEAVQEEVDAWANDL